MNISIYIIIWKYTEEVFFFQMYIQLLCKQFFKQVFYTPVKNFDGTYYGMGSVRPSTISLIDFFLKTTGWNLIKFGWKHPWLVGIQKCTNEVADPPGA